MRKTLFWAMFIVMSAAFYGCHTMVGVGKDLQGAGPSLDEWDQKNKSEAAQRKTLSQDNPYR